MAATLVLELSTRSGEVEIRDPSWKDVEGTLRSLDGETRCELFLGDPDSRAGLIMSGGPDRYLVWIQRWDDTGQELVIDTAKDHRAPGGTVRFTLSNGQVDEHLLASTVDLDTAIRASRTFFETGDVDKDVTWDHRG